MIQRRVTELDSVALMVSTITLAENVDSEANDNVLQIGHLLGRNWVKVALHREGSKISL